MFVGIVEEDGVHVYVLYILDKWDLPQFSLGALPTLQNCFLGDCDGVGLGVVEIHFFVIVDRKVSRFDHFAGTE
jgi:hypothetical protein